MTLTDQDLSALEAMEKSATEAPWGTETKDAYGVEYRDPIRVVAGEYSVAYHGSPSCFLKKQDAALIAAMRNALPALIAEVRASREALKVAEHALTVARGICGPMVRKHRTKINEAIATVRKAKGD